MADAKKPKAKSTRKPGPRFAVKLVDGNGVGLKIGTSFDYRNKLFKVQPSVWPKGFGKGNPRERVEATTVGADFAEAEAKAKEVVAEAEAAGWERIAQKGSATYSAIPAPGTVAASE